MAALGQPELIPAIPAGPSQKRCNSWESSSIFDGSHVKLHGSAHSRQEVPAQSRESAHFHNKANVFLSAVYLWLKNVNSEGIRSSLPLVSNGIICTETSFYSPFWNICSTCFFYSEIKCEKQLCNRQQMLLLSVFAEQWTPLCHLQLWNA